MRMNEIIGTSEATRSKSLTCASHGSVSDGIGFSYVEADGAAFGDVGFVAREGGPVGKRQGHLRTASLP